MAFWRYKILSVLSVVKRGRAIGSPLQVAYYGAGDFMAFWRYKNLCAL